VSSTARWSGAPEEDAADPDPLIDFAKVTLRRGRQTLVGPITWSVELDERWVVIAERGGQDVATAHCGRPEYPSSARAVPASGWAALTCPNCSRVG
jgi:iron complex transport system ATP-binding protein